MARRKILTLSVAVAASAALTALVVRAAPPAAACGNYSDWGPPVNLGPVVNSVYNDAGPTVLDEDDGTTTLWFSAPCHSS